MENFIILDDINVTPLLKAHDTFKHGLKIAHSQLERDGVIQRFEYTLELSWKLLRKILKFKGIEVNSPRDTFRESAAIGLIQDPEVWFDFLQKRNLTSHTYNQEISDEIYLILQMANDKFEELIETVCAL